MEFPVKIQFPKQELVSPIIPTPLQALPPQVQRMREIEALLNHTIWQSEEFSNEMICSIKKTDTGYDVTTTSYHMHFTIQPLPPINIGPAQFNVVFDPSSVEKRASANTFGISPSQMKGELADLLLEICKTPATSTIEEIKRTEEGYTFRTNENTFTVFLQHV